VSQQVKRIGGNAVLDAVIKRTVKVANAMAARQPIIQYAESSDVASAYRQAVHEIMEVLNHGNQTTGD
jgi:cellulose biosynthesis protein BcsQ